MYAIALTKMPAKLVYLMYKRVQEQNVTRLFGVKIPSF